MSKRTGSARFGMSAWHGIFEKEGEVSGYDFSKYVCGVTGLVCCGCSLYCEHRKEVTE